MSEPRSDDPHQCFFLRRDMRYCGQESIVIMTYGGGIGACQAHITPLLLWCMEKNARGQLPERTVTVVPAWRWDEQYPPIDR